MARKPSKPAGAAEPAQAGADANLYRVKVSRSVDVAGFVYKPGHAHTVDRTTLEAIEAQNAVAHVSAAS